MAKTTKEAYDLTDAEKRDLIQLIQQGKALPEKYRWTGLDTIGYFSGRWPPYPMPRPRFFPLFPPVL